MFISANHYLGDTWYFTDNGKVHMFYLTCPDNIERHTAWDIGHAVSADLKHWQTEDVILRRGKPNSYDGNCPATGSVIKVLNRYWLAYTGNWNGPQPSVAIAVSDDLYHWEKIRENPITTINPRYYDAEPASIPRDWLHWRDPFLFEFQGHIYHYVCAKINQGIETKKGTLGLAETQDMRHWKVLPPPEVAPITAELECPQVYEINGKWYLLFSSNYTFFIETYQKKYFQRQERWTSFSMVGDSPFGPYKMIGDGLVIPQEYPVQPYANQLVKWEGRYYLMGTVWNDSQDFITDPIPVQINNDGIKVTI